VNPLPIDTPASRTRRSSAAPADQLPPGRHPALLGGAQRSA